MCLKIPLILIILTMIQISFQQENYSTFYKTLPENFCKNCCSKNITQATCKKQKQTTIDQNMNQAILDLSCSFLFSLELLVFLMDTPNFKEKLQHT
jgi:hypothetical protein